MEESLYRPFVIAFLSAKTGADIALDDRETDLRALANRHGLKIHRFKKSGILPRVQVVLGILRSVAPASLLDMGTGRGAFLWPFLEAFPDVLVTCVDILDHRREMLEAVARGGIGRLSVNGADGAALPFADDSFDVATALEVLEHQHDPAPMAAELLRVARRFVIVSVPSQPDDNPEHVQLFTEEALRALFTHEGARSVTFSHVPGHIIAVVRAP